LIAQFTDQMAGRRRRISFLRIRQVLQSGCALASWSTLADSTAMVLLH
jgi:hypothetical protein